MVQFQPTVYFSMASRLRMAFTSLRGYVWPTSLKNLLLTLYGKCSLTPNPEENLGTLFLKSFPSDCAVAISKPVGRSVFGIHYCGGRNVIFGARETWVLLLDLR